jgi:hypothetical protein
MEVFNKKNGADNASVMVFARIAKTHATIRIAAHFGVMFNSRKRIVFTYKK